MKSIYRRQRQQYVFAALLGVIGVVNLLFFLILYRPARSEYYGLQESIQRLHGEVQSRKQSVERLEKLNAQLETSEQDRRQLFTTHFISRATGYSEILPKLERIAEDAAVKTTRKEYAIDEAPQYSLYSVKIRIPVTGGYSNVVDFIRSLENSDTFFIINSIDVRGAGASTPAASEISLALNLETFFYR
jgi:hypothetical protein